MVTSTAEWRRRTLYMVILEHPGLTIPQLAPLLIAATGVASDGHAHIKSALVRLVERGQIEWSGPEPLPCNEIPWGERKWYPTEASREAYRERVARRGGAPRD